jgi:hypothetical protein
MSMFFLLAGHASAPDPVLEIPFLVMLPA